MKTFGLRLKCTLEMGIKWIKNVAFTFYWIMKMKIYFIFFLNFFGYLTNHNPENKELISKRNWEYIISSTTKMNLYLIYNSEDLQRSHCLMGRNREYIKLNDIKILRPFRRKLRNFHFTKFYSFNFIGLR